MTDNDLTIPDYPTDSILEAITAGAIELQAAGEEPTILTDILRANRGDYPQEQKQTLEDLLYGEHWEPQSQIETQLQRVVELCNGSRSQALDWWQVQRDNPSRTLRKQRRGEIADQWGKTPDTIKRSVDRAINAIADSLREDPMAVNGLERTLPGLQNSFTRLFETLELDTGVLANAPRAAAGPTLYVPYRDEDGDRRVRYFVLSSTVWQPFSVEDAGGQLLGESHREFVSVEAVRGRGAIDNLSGDDALLGIVNGERATFQRTDTDLQITTGDGTRAATDVDVEDACEDVLVRVPEETRDSIHDLPTDEQSEDDQ